MAHNYKEISDQAYQLHVQHKYEDAEKLYKTLLEISPQDVNILNLYGLLCIANNRYEEAISLLSRAVVLSKSQYILVNLAKAYLSNKNYDNAIKLFKEALEIKPTDDIYYSLGIAYKKSKKIDEAVKAYQEALKLNNKHYNASCNLAIICKDVQMYDYSIRYANLCLKIKPESEEIFVLLSFVYEKINDLNKAIQMLEKASSINPNEHLYYYNLAVLYSKINNISLSVENYLNVLSIKPDHVQSLVNLCTLLKSRDKTKALQYILRAKIAAPNEKNVILNLAQIYKDLSMNTESIDELNKLISSDSKCHEAYSLIAINYMDMGEYSTAYEFYNKALQLAPDNDIYLQGKAVSLKYLGKTDESQQILEQIIERKPDLKEAKIALGMIYLSQKDMQKGMQLYIERDNDTIVKSKFEEKLWQIGDKLDNKSVLVYSNCGLGDTVMFSRYIHNLKEIAKKVIIQTDEEVVSLLKNNYSGVQIIPKHKIPSSVFSVAIPIMDLPYALNMDFDNIPLADGYIKPDKLLKNKYKFLNEFKNNKLKVGLFWQGNKRILKNRSIDFSYFDTLRLNENVQFYSFQLDSDLNPATNVIELKKYISDFNDTAAMLANIDILITIDSSIAHVAGAMGIKTFLMLPYTAEWRWFSDTKKTPWYKSVRIFKQPAIGDWQSVIKSINSELKKYANK